MGTLRGLVTSQGRIIEAQRRQIRELAMLAGLSEALEQALNAYCELTVCDGMPEGKFCEAQRGLWDAWLDRVCSGSVGSKLKGAAERRRALYDAWDLYQARKARMDAVFIEPDTDLHGQTRTDGG